MRIHEWEGKSLYVDGFDLSVDNVKSVADYCRLFPITDQVSNWDDYRKLEGKLKKSNLVNPQCRYSYTALELRRST
jgi:hypothetical protein